MRFAHILSAANLGWVGWLWLATPILAQGVVTLPTAMPSSGTGVPCTPGTPGCSTAPVTGYAPNMGYAPGMEILPEMVNSPTTTWDPYSAAQPGFMPGITGQPGVYCGECAPVQQRTLRFGVFGEYLYWRPGNSATTDFAVPINGGIVPPDESTIPVGPISTLNPEFDNGFRAGFWWARTSESQLGATYTHYENSVSELSAIDPANNVVLLALLVHPATVAADFFFTDAAASYSLEYKTLDLDYRHVFMSDCVYRVNYLAGVRWLRYEDSLAGQFTSPTRIESVQANNDFDGFGIRGGFEGEWGGQQGGIFGYGKAIAGAAAGRMKSDYQQFNNFEGVVVTTSREDDRIVPTVEVEVGVGWRSQNQRWIVSAGYNITALFNVASANTLVNSVQTARYNDNEDTFTLDGLVARLEFGF